MQFFSPIIYIEKKIQETDPRKINGVLAYIYYVLGKKCLMVCNFIYA